MNFKICIIFCIIFTYTLAHRGDEPHHLLKRKDRPPRHHVTHDHNRTRTSHHTTNRLEESGESEESDESDKNDVKPDGSNGTSLTSNYRDDENGKMNPIKDQYNEDSSENVNDGKDSNRIIEVVTLHPIQAAHGNNIGWNSLDKENPISIHGENNKPIYTPTNSWNHGNNPNSNIVIDQNPHENWSSETKPNKSGNIDKINKLTEKNNPITNNQREDGDYIPYDTTEDNRYKYSTYTPIPTWNGDHILVDPNKGSQSQQGIDNEIINPSHKPTEKQFNNRNWYTGAYDIKTSSQVPLTDSSIKIKPENRPGEYGNGNSNPLGQNNELIIPSQSTGIENGRDSEYNDSNNVNGEYPGENMWSNTIKYDDDKPYTRKPITSFGKTNDVTEEPQSNIDVFTQKSHSDFPVLSASEKYDNVKFDTAPPLSEISPANARELVTSDDTLFTAATKKPSEVFSGVFSQRSTESPRNVNDNVNQIWSGNDNDGLAQSTPKFSVDSDHVNGINNLGEGNSPTRPTPGNNDNVVSGISTVNYGKDVTPDDRIRFPGPTSPWSANSPISAIVEGPPLPIDSQSNTDGSSTTRKVVLDDKIYFPGEGNWESGRTTSRYIQSHSRTSTTTAGGITFDNTPYTSATRATTTFSNILTTSTESPQNTNNENKGTSQIWPEDYWTNNDVYNNEETPSSSSLTSNGVNVGVGSSQNWPAAVTPSTTTQREVTYNNNLNTGQTAKIPGFPPSATPRSTESPLGVGQTSSPSRFTESTQSSTRSQLSSASIAIIRTIVPQSSNPSNLPSSTTRRVVVGSTVTAKVFELDGGTLPPGGSTRQQMITVTPTNINFLGQTSTTRVTPLPAGSASNVNGSTTVRVPPLIGPTVPGTTQQPTNQSVNIQVQPAGNSSINIPVGVNGTAAGSIPVIIKPVIVIQPVAVPAVPIALPCRVAQSPCQAAASTQLSANEIQSAAITLLQTPCSAQKGILLSALAPCPVEETSTIRANKNIIKSDGSCSTIRARVIKVDNKKQINKLKINQVI